MRTFIRNLVKEHIIKFLSLNLIFLLLSEFQLSAQNDTVSVKEIKSEPQDFNISLFSSDEILNVSIYMDLGTFLKKTSQNDSFDAEINIKISSADTLKSKAKLKYRGIIRKEICSFPPIEINFKKPLNCDCGKIKKLKLVTHCEPGSRTDEYVLREYLVYKLFNSLTDTSLRARLLKVSYIDTKKIKRRSSNTGYSLNRLKCLQKG
jgi:hypothetical protein